MEADWLISGCEIPQKWNVFNVYGSSLGEVRLHNPPRTEGLDLPRISATLGDDAALLKARNLNERGTTGRFQNSGRCDLVDERM